MKNRKVILVLALAVFMSFDRPASTKEIEVTGAEVYNKSKKGKITFFDDRKVKIVMEKPAETFVLFPKEAQALVAVNGGTQKFRGIHPEDQKANANRVIAKHYPDLLTLNTGFAIDGGFNPNVEELLKIKPDVVYQWTSRGDEAYLPMIAAGIAVVSVGWGNWDDDIERLKLYAAALGETERVNDLLKRQDKIKDEMQAVTLKIPDHKRRTHVFVDSIEGNEVRIWGKELAFTTIHGVDNAAYTKGGITTPGETINVETLLSWDPDIIVLNSFRNKRTPDEVYRNPLLKDLAAVKNKRVYKFMDTSLVDNPISSWYWYGVLAYPELFARYDMRDRLTQDYKYLYNIDLTEDDLNAILLVNENSQSLGYEKFLSK